MKTITLCTLAAITFATSTQAQSIIDPVSASASPSSLGSPYSPPSALIDQSGLSANYVSGSTDFATFTATTTATYTFGPTFPELSAVTGVAGSYWQFNLGSAMGINAIAVWNQSGSGSLNTFNVQTSLLPDFSVSQTYGTYTMVPLGGAYPASANDFYFAPTTAQYVRIDVLSNAGYTGGTILNEVAFEASPVPEPSTLALAGLGSLGLARVLIRRRQM